MSMIGNYLLLNAPHKRQVYFLMTVISAVYLFNFHINDIWTPNESFYAEAVREMFESGNFLEIFYNYEPRYNKPPLTYWLMALSAGIFGVSEFALRLPIVLMGLGSIWLTYLLGKAMYSERGGLYAMLMMSFSLQLLAVKQYASPEMPLTFFFTLTLYWFYRGYKDQRFKYLLYAYFALGLTVLTKGYPYLIVIGGIIGAYVLWDSQLNLKILWQKVKALKLHIGLPIVLVVGLSWIIYMYLKDGQEFWAVYKRETFERAFTRKSNGLKPFFYLEVMSWSILPYSLACIYVICYWVKRSRQIKKVVFPICWFLVMMVIFTIAKGKIPTYFIQAHPALFLLMVPPLLEYRPGNKLWSAVWQLSFMFPAILIVGATTVMIYSTNLPYVLYLIPLLGLMVFVYWVYSYKRIKSDLLVVGPFWIMAGFLFCFSFFLPRMEQFRPYDQIGDVINTQLNIDPSVDIQIENTLIHNIPFYAKRFAQRDMSKAEINALPGPVLALVRAEEMEVLEGFKSVWNGYIYDSSSESQFFKFVMACIEAEKGNMDAFAQYHLVTRGID